MATMNRDGLAALYEYDAYANHLVLDGLAQLSEDEFAHAPSPSRSTVRTLLLHSLLGEAWFLAACQGRKFEPPDLPTLDDIRRFQSELEKEQHATQHRAELGIVLGQMGHPLPTMDIIVHFVYQSGQPWPPK